MSLRVWDLNSKTCIQVMSGHSKRVLSILLYNNILNLIDKQLLLLSVDSNKTIKMWDLLRGECIQTIETEMQFLRIESAYNLDR